MLYNLTEGITIGASLLYSFMPETSEKILKELNTEKRALWDMDTFGLYPNGNKVSEAPEILFARMDVNELLKKVEEMFPKAEEPKEEETTEEESFEIKHKPNVSFEDFMKLELRVGEVIACEEVPKSKKLLKETIKFGNETRTIVSGIKKWYSAEEMVGKKVMVVTNLKPAKLAGMISEGMILCAEDAEGNVVLMQPEKDVPAGAEIG